MSFDSQVQSKEDDIMDAFAYLLWYVVGRNFDVGYAETEEYDIQDEWA